MKQRVLSTRVLDLIVTTGIANSFRSTGRLRATDTGMLWSDCTQPVLCSDCSKHADERNGVYLE
jgi:hypothetical protein